MSRVVRVSVLLLTAFVITISPVQAQSVAQLTWPTNGATGLDLSHLATWTSAANAQAYYLYVGTTPGAKDVQDSGETSRTDWPICGAPTGRLLYARIWTKVNSVWSYSPDISFTAATSPPCTAVLTQPASGSGTVDLTSGFAWSSVTNATAYYLYVGTSVGSKNLTDSFEITGTSYVAYDLPAGPILYVRLWTLAGPWRYVDYTFTGSAAPISPSITSVTPTSGVADQAITINGANFGAMQGASTVTFSGALGVPTSWSASTITTTVPAGASSGPVVVKGDGHAASNGVNFTVQSAPTSATYHLHKEVNPDRNGLYALKTEGPDSSAFEFTSNDWRNISFTGTAYFAQFATVIGLPNVSGVIPAGSSFTASVWMKKSSSWGTVFPYVLLRKWDGNVTTTDACSVTGNSELTTTLTRYVLTCTTTNPLVMTSTDRFSLDVGMTFTSPPGNHSLVIALDVEGALNGNYDSTLTAPLPPPPSITSATPVSGPAGAGVTLTGTNFGSAPGTVTFNTKTAPVTSWSDSTISVVVPQGATTGPLVVRRGTIPSNGMTFTVTPPPTITSVTPSAATRGAAVTINGNYFGASQGNSVVTFHGVAVTPVSWSSTAVGITVPATATTGAIVIQNGTATSNAATFTVITTGGLSGTITRSGGTPIAGALVQAIYGGTIKSTATTTGTGTYSIPNLEYGTYDVRVSASGFAAEMRAGITITAAATTSLNVSLTLPGTISGRVTHADGTTAISGATVAVYAGTLAGTVTTDSGGNYSLTGLHSGALVMEASALGYRTKEQTVTVAEAGNSITNFALGSEPTGAVTYVYDELNRLVSVTDPSGDSAIYSYDAVGNILSIARTGSTTVAISEFTPNTGPAGTAVTMYGTGFASTPAGNTVSIGGTTASVTAATPTQITAVVSAAATTGPIVVTSANGSASSSNSFVVGSTGAPTLTGFTPLMAVAGANVTVTGTNFDTSTTNDRLTFNAGFVSVTQATATSLVAIVSSTATTGRIVVGTPMGTAVSAADFFVVPTPYTPANVSVADRMTAGSSRVMSLPSGTIALLLVDGVKGQRLTAQIDQVTMPSATAKIYGPQGAIVAAGSFGAGGIFLDGLLPATGTYTIFVAPDTGYSGSASLSVATVTDVTGAIAPGGPSQTVTTSTGQNASLTFSGTAGHRVSLQMTNATYSANVNISILNPDGTTLVSSCCIESFANFIDVTTLTQSGTHTIRIDPSGAIAGSVTVALFDVPTDSTGTVAAGGAAVTVTTTTPGQNASLTFSGTAGQLATVRVTSNTIGLVTITLRRSDGATLTSSISSAAVFDLAQQTLPTTGTYTIAFDPNGTNTGSLSVSVTNP
jgi:YD repeat-containing protein